MIILKLNTKSYLLLFICVVCSYSVNAQRGVKIGTNNSTADPSAILEVESTDKGVLLPRMTEAQRNAIPTPATGLLIFQTDATPGFYYWNGSNWQSIASSSNTQPAWPAGTAHCNTPTAIVDVVSVTGKTWMDRNLGASQVAASSSDVDSYGDLYQWGRFSDGHQCRSSAITTTLSAGDQPGHGDFIVSASSPKDWRTGQNDNLWQGVNGINNPCPNGYRVPTYAEFNDERQSWSSNNAAGAFGSPLKLPLAGYRNNNSNGAVSSNGNYGYYWMSTVSGTTARRLYFLSSNAYMLTFDRSHGISVRCIKE